MSLSLLQLNMIAVPVSFITGFMIAWVIKSSNEDTGPNFFKIYNDYDTRELIKIISTFVVKYEFSSWTKSRTITNMFFDLDNKEYRAKLTIETRKHFEENKEKRRAKDEDDK